jgi:hypothetical protein
VGDQGGLSAPLDGPATSGEAERAFQAGDWMRARTLARDEVHSRTAERFRNDPAIALLFAGALIFFFATIALTVR